MAGFSWSLPHPVSRETAAWLWRGASARRFQVHNIGPDSVRLCVYLTADGKLTQDEIYLQPAGDVDVEGFGVFVDLQAGKANAAVGFIVEK